MILTGKVSMCQDVWFLRNNLFSQTFVLVPWSKLKPEIYIPLLPRLRDSHNTRGLKSKLTALEVPRGRSVLLTIF